MTHLFSLSKLLSQKKTSEVKCKNAGIVEKKFFNNDELKKFIEDGVIAYLEKYPIKQIVKEVILKKK